MLIILILTLKGNYLGEEQNFKFKNFGFNISNSQGKYKCYYSIKMFLHIQSVMIVKGLLSNISQMFKRLSGKI